MVFSTASLELMNVYIVNGKNIKDIESLCNEFARAVDSPDGYFGKNMQGFDDCLFGGFGLETPCKIIWKDASESKKLLNCEMLKKYCEDILKNSEYIHQTGFEESKEWCISTLNAAIEGRRTLFDEVVDLIVSVPSRATWDHEIELVLEC